MEDKPLKTKEYTCFWKFVVERQNIWYRRMILKEEYPWTDDPILQKYRFTNVYRELDKSTHYLLNFLSPLKKDRKNILFNVLIFRFFNSYGFFDKIGSMLHVEKYNPFEFIRKLDELKRKKIKFFNNAYLIPHPSIRKDYRPGDKHVQLAFCFDAVKEKIDMLIARIDDVKTPGESLEIIKQIPGVGSFLAYEVWTDLTYFKWFKQRWSDNDFVNVGPGARWGLNIMVGKDTPKFILPAKEYEKLVFKLRDEMQPALKKLNLLNKWMKIYYRHAFSNKPFLSLRNIEHSLCEFRKYRRLSKGVGRKRLFKYQSF